MEFNPLPDLLNTGFMVANIWKRKYADFDFFDKMAKFN